MKKSIYSNDDRLGLDANMVNNHRKASTSTSSPPSSVLPTQKVNHNNLLTVPESPLASKKREISNAFDDFRRKSISELSLVMDALRGSSPGSSQYIHPERASQSTGNLNQPSNASKKGKRRRKVQKTWAAMSPGNFTKQFHIVQEEKAMQAVPTSPIDASKFVAYVQERRKKRILFKGEYLMVNRSIDNNKCRCDVGSTMMDRNPYPDTLPYDFNRVILPRIDEDENSHYINASYVNSWLKDKAYVVTQAVRTKPMNSEFWRMVWELGSNCIVMLTKVFDFMRVMCLQYWPQTKFQFREIEVETIEVKTYSHFVIRTFKLTKTTSESTETRIVKHFHFTEWELDSFPYISALIELRRRVRQYMERNSVDAPLIVHCSNGAGRSGAFLALDANLELMKKTGQLDFFEYAKTLVNSRPHLIDSVDQYIFIYEVLAEAVLCNVQPIEMNELKERSSMYKAKKNRELLESQESHENKLLIHLTPTLRIGDCAGGHRLENRGKNRDVMVVPPDHARPYLQTLHGESKDYTYINAVEVDGFTRKAEFIVTEWPKQSTIDSFWTLIYDHACHTVVNLTNQGGQRHFPTFIHNKGKANYGPFIVEIMNYHQYPAMTSHMVKVMKRVDPPNSKPTGKIPTLDGVPGYQARPGIAPGQSFRYKPMYRGKLRHMSIQNNDNDDYFEKNDEKTSVKFQFNLSPPPPQQQSLFSSSSSSSLSTSSMPFPCSPRKTSSNQHLLIPSNMMMPHGIRQRSRSAENIDPYRETFMINDIMATGAQNQQIDAEVRICCVIQVRMWPIENKVPLSTTGLIDVIKMARSWRKRAPDRPETKPTIVVSHNGVSRVGVYIGANICIDQMDIDHEVDVFHAVKMMRINRPQLIDMKDEYKYLYDVMLHWYLNNPEYRIYDKEDKEDVESTKTISRPSSNRQSIKEKSSFKSKFSFRRRNTKQNDQAQNSIENNHHLHLNTNNK